MITYLYLVQSGISVYAINSSGVLHFIAFSSISFVISFLLIAIAESSFNCYLLNAFYYIYKTDSIKLILLEIIFLIISYSSLLSKTVIFHTKKQPWMLQFHGCCKVSLPVHLILLFVIGTCQCACE